ncbi:MAG: DNA transposition protein [Magnetovibrionaceae bacterium]
MARHRACDQTMELGLEGQHEPIVARFKDEEVRAGTVKAELARAVATVLIDRDREDVATKMADWLDDESMSKNMLDAYASQGRESHDITASRLLALMMVTGDFRPLQMLAEKADHIVVDYRYEYWVEVGRKSIEAEQHTERAQQARRERDAFLQEAKRRAK